jgi:hypothetical protein
MKLSRNQQIALLFLNHWDSHEWTSVDAVLRMHGSQSCGHRTCISLVKKGLASESRPHDSLVCKFRITGAGREVARTLSLSVTIEEK